MVMENVDCILNEEAGCKAVYSMYPFLVSKKREYSPIYSCIKKKLSMLYIYIYISC